MNEQEQQEMLDKDPQAFWANIHVEAMAGISAMQKKMFSDLQGALSFYINAYTELIDMQGKELAIFRTLETRMRQGSLTEPQLKEQLSLLDGLRAEIQAKNAERLAAGSTKQ